MWAVPLGNGRYRLDNIPFYAKLVSDGDVVAASIIDGDLTFEEILEASGNCTIRVITLDDSDGSEVRKVLEDIGCKVEGSRSEEHTSELQSLMRISYAVFCLKTKNNNSE